MKLSTFLNFVSNSSTALIKLTLSDFHIAQNQFLYKYKALFLSVIVLGKTLIPSKYPKLKILTLKYG